MTTPKTDAIMALADRYAFHIPGSQHSDEARAALLAALQEQAPNPWKEAVLDQLAFHAMDAPINMPPADILKRIIDVSVTMATDPAITQQPVQAPKRLWGMAGFNPPLPNVGEKYTSIHEDDLGDHVTVTGIANASSPNIAYVFLSWDDGHYGERAIDEFWQEYMMVQTNDQAREGEAVAWLHGCNVLCADIDLWIDRCPHCGKPRPAAPAPQPAREGEAVPDNQILWLWKNGDSYLAFSNLFPCFTQGGDPMTLGEPSLSAVFRKSYDRHAAPQPAREGWAVVPSAILARGRFHFFKGEDGEPDDWEWFEEGTNCEHGCIDAVIVRADALSAPQPAQPSEPAQPEQGERAAQKAELLKNLTQWLDGLGGAIHTYSLRGIALHGFEKGWDAALQSAQPVEARQPKFFVGTDMQDGVLTVSVLQREPDGVAVLVHHEEITVSAQPVAQPLPMTDAWIRERTTQPWVFETVKQWVKEIEAAHGIGGAR